MPRLTPIQRQKLINAVEAGEPLKDAADRLNIVRSTAYSTVKMAAQRDEEQRDLPRSGRPRMTSSSSDARLVRAIKRAGTDPWSAILDTTPLSKKTVLQRICEIEPGLRRYKLQSNSSSIAGGHISVPSTKEVSGTGSPTNVSLRRSGRITTGPQSSSMPSGTVSRAKNKTRAVGKRRRKGS